MHFSCFFKGFLLNNSQKCAEPQWIFHLDCELARVSNGSFITLDLQVHIAFYSLKWAIAKVSFLLKDTKHSVVRSPCYSKSTRMTAIVVLSICKTPENAWPVTINKRILAVQFYVLSSLKDCQTSCKWYNGSNPLIFTSWVSAQEKPEVSERIGQFIQGDNFHQPSHLT